MPLLYPIRRVFRSWKLFLALLIGIVLASTFFAGIDVKANLAARQALDQRLNRVIVDMEFNTRLNYSNLELALNNVSSIDGVKSVDIVSRFGLPISLSSDNYTTRDFTNLACTPNSSKVYSEWLNKPLDGLGENQTYIIADTPLARKVAVGDNISTAINFPSPKIYDANTTTVYLNLTVAGYAELSEIGYSLITGDSYFYSPLNPSYGREIYRPSLMIVSWENTLDKIWSTLQNRTIEAYFSVYIDRDKLISPWNSQASAENVQRVADNIENTVLASYEIRGDVRNNLAYALTDFESAFSFTFFNFMIVSLPIFFVACYLGSTVSDVSFNLRRREIGLLSTKGLSSRQIQRMFLTEALAIGLIGGFLGVVGGLILNQILSGNGLQIETLFNPQNLNPNTMIFTVVFGVILSLFSVFWSARRAARLPAVETLREYMSFEMDKPYRKKLPWIAFILGTVKIIMLIFGVSVQSLLINPGFFGGNYFLMVLLVPLMYLDLLLTYIAPLLFMWGVTKLLIQNSLKFQQLTSNIYRLMGDLGALAAKNVRRSPGRLAAIAFIIAIIIMLSVQVTGQIVSEQDYALRQVQYQVGTDGVTLMVANATKGREILDYLVANVTGIKNATIECTLRQSYAGTIIKTIDPDSWSVTAYYEPEWFSQSSMEQAFKELNANNMTIILERRVAKQHNYKLYDEIGIDFPSGARKLKIVGFFGPEPREIQGIMPSRIPAQPNAPSIYYGGVQMWSFVPRNLFNMSSPFSDAFHAEAFETKILLKLNEGVNGTQTAEAIRNLGLDLEIYGVDSFDEQWRSSQEMNNPYTYSSLQVLDVQRLGLVFAVLAASVGTALISIVSLKERSREATIMSVRGLSYRQLVWMFLSENIAVITFSVILGVCVGLIIVYGNIASASTVTSELIKKRIVFPTEFLVTIGTYISLIYAATVGSILVMTSQYVTKLERMIRTR